MEVRRGETIQSSPPRVCEICAPRITSLGGANSARQWSAFAEAVERVVAGRATGTDEGCVRHVKFRLRRFGSRHR